MVVHTTIVLHIVQVIILVMKLVQHMLVMMDIQNIMTLIVIREVNSFKHLMIGAFIL